MSKTSQPEFTEALLDADILVYRVAWASQNESEGIAVSRLNTLITGIVDRLGVSDYTAFLTSNDKSNFRYFLSPDYKNNRVQPKPVHYGLMREVLERDYGAIVVTGMEADDAISTRAMESNGSVIVSIDKDLDQVPGWHFNFVKEVLYNISPIEAHRQFYSQVLIGDTSDNIKGCPKIGKIKAERILEGETSEYNMAKAVLECYNTAYGEDGKDRMYLACSLLWLRREANQEWKFPNEKM